MVNSFDVMAAQVANCSILKPPQMVDGIRGNPVSYITNLDCTPIDPVADDFRLEPPLEKPTKLYRTCVETSQQILNGYKLTQGSDSYIIRNVNSVVFRGKTSQILILEKDTKNA